MATSDTPGNDLSNHIAIYWLGRIDGPTEIKFDFRDEDGVEKVFRIPRLQL